MVWNKSTRLNSLTPLPKTEETTYAHYCILFDIWYDGGIGISNTNDKILT